MTRDEVDAFIAAPFSRSRTNLFDLVARLLLVIFFATVLSYVIDVLLNNPGSGRGFAWWMFYIVYFWVTPVNAIFFVLTPFALKVAAFRFATTSDSPARVSDIVGVRTIQCAAALLATGSLLNCGALLLGARTFFGGDNIATSAISLVSPLCTGVVSILVFILCQRICPSPADD